MVKYFILFVSIFSLYSTKINEEKILFSSGRNGNSDIFIMDANGKNQIALTQNQEEDWAPTWIDKNNISFLRQKGDSIVRVKLNLRNGKESTLSHPVDCNLTDKNTLYSSNKTHELYSCKDDIFILNPENGKSINITINLKGKALYPGWSSDGNKVLFTSNHSGTNEIYLYDLNSKDIIQLTDSDSNNERGDLSPDGKLLIYSSDYFEKGNQDILIKNLDTGEIKHISNSPGMELIARFSSDGNDIFYGSNKDGNWEIYSYNLNSETHTRLTNNKEFDGDPRVLKH
ncbi:TolB family protein [Mangrovivirga cuniculi]|uniref:DUF5050 domain-containing protein n=1 Tax=Mangrovivirga cuniculi TaxID=2715131 RepID=A0A4D7JJD8_9BACT|nr:PD40 domain-containing protein [Mangrovivirga cuniculi]QCK15711.1 hypothetical protein DCC35_13635 [Mangrovivirga cuniculi]